MRSFYLFFFSKWTTTKNIRMNVYSSSPDSLNADRSDKSNTISPSPVALYKLVVPLLRRETADVCDAAVNALGMINHDALKWVLEEFFFLI